MERTFELDVQGCRPEPLAAYLKGLAVLRLVAEQADPDARACWRGEHLVLFSRLDRQGLERFFLETWQPTPVVAPWNGGSGFYPKDNKAAPDAILASDDSRLEDFRQTLSVARAFVAARKWEERPADEEKRRAVTELRGRLPDSAVGWIDSAVVIGEDRLLFPPLLGTGGNDGRLDFSNNYQQRVIRLVQQPDRVALAAALFEAASESSFKGAMGQFLPGASDQSNPWDFALLIEGALVFAGAVTRRWEPTSPQRMSFPFHARAAGGVGTVTDWDEAESRDELWLPLWTSPATFGEVRQLFAEGRASVGAGDGARQAGTGLDFARAVASLGVDRGISSFARVGFHMRFGLTYFATPLGRFAVREVPQVRLLDRIDGWFERFRRAASGKNVPARVAVAKRRLETAMFEATQRGEVGPVLLALGEAERALVASRSFTDDTFLSPVPALPSEWARAVRDGSVEQRLAAALAGRLGMRARVTPLDERGSGFGRADDRRVVFAERPLIENLHALLRREEIERERGELPLGEEPELSPASLADIAAFVEGRVDDDLVDRWLRALVLVKGPLGVVREAAPLPPALFAVLALAHHRRIGEEVVPRTPTLLERACSGDAEGASRAALRRLRATGRPLPVEAIAAPRPVTRRVAAALSFPLTRGQRRMLEGMVLSREPDRDAGAEPSPAEEIA